MQTGYQSMKQANNLAAAIFGLKSPTLMFIHYLCTQDWFLMHSAWRFQCPLLMYGSPFLDFVHGDGVSA